MTKKISEVEQHWINTLIGYMEKAGWKNDRNDDDSIGFSFIDGDKHFIRDYHKETHRFIQYDANQKINLVVHEERTL